MLKQLRDLMHSADTEHTTKIVWICNSRAPLEVSEEPKVSERASERKRERVLYKA